MAHLLLIPFMLFALFLRTEMPSIGTSGGTLAVALSGVLLVVLLAFMVARRRLYFTSSLVGPTLFLIAALASALGSMLNPDVDRALALRYASEVMATGIVFFAIYYVVRERWVSIPSVATVIAILGLGVGIYMMADFFATAGSLRRLEVFGGRNYIASAYVACSLAWLYLIFRRSYAATIVPVVLALGWAAAVLVLLLIASRQALMAMLVTTLWGFIWLKARAKWPLFAAGTLSAIALGIVAVAYLEIPFDISLWLGRFNYDELLRATQERVSIPLLALMDTTLGSAVTGRPDLYELWPGSMSVHAHNAVVSAAQYSGIATALIFAFATLHSLIESMRVVRVARMHGRVDLAMDTALSVGLFVAAILYVSVSGNFTRVFNLYIFWALAVAARDVTRSQLLMSGTSISTLQHVPVIPRNMHSIEAKATRVDSTP